jgi:hypothetical protein
VRLAGAQEFIGWQTAYRGSASEVAAEESTRRIENGTMDSSLQEAAPPASCPETEQGLWRNALSHPLLRVPVLLLLFCCAAIFEAKHLTSLADYDVWWHLRTGSWILQNHAFPRHALFTQYSDRPWIAYSWGFEVATAEVYRLMGLRGIPVFMLCLKVVMAVMIFRLARGSIENFWPAVLLGAIGQYAITDFKLRPGALSILCFSIELILLFESRRTGKVSRLYWLPLLFACWANLHIQFVYGLFALGLFLLAVLVKNICGRFGVDWFAGGMPLAPATVFVVTLLCVGATLLTPYSFRNYKVAWDYAHNTAAYSYIAEMHAMNFRWPEHYVRLLLLMAALVTMGSQRPWNLFGLALIVCAAMVGFRQQRDTWFMVLASIAILADGGLELSHFVPRSGQGKLARIFYWEKLLTAALVIIVLVVTVHAYIPSSRDALLLKVDETFPVQACDFIREHRLPQPIFNPLNWGGFLIWYLPDYPVAIDGRTDLYGDEIMVRQYKVWDGEVPVWKEPTFVSARTLLMERNSGLAQAVSESPAYRLAYADKNAAVFVRMR